jgi:hypothetical protein
MDAAEQLPLEETEPLSWVEICIWYPDQYVCLVDIDWAELRSPEIKTAQVVGYGATRRAAFHAVGVTSARNTRGTQSGSRVSAQSR